MKKRLLYIAVLILTGITNSAFIYGQGSSMLDKLQGKTWRSQWSDGGNKDYKYTRNTVTIIYEDGESSDDRSFYLSDTPETRFDYNKVGKVENGKYLIREGYPNSEDDPEFRIFVNEIVKLTDTEFVIKLRNGAISTRKVLKVSP